MRRLSSRVADDSRLHAGLIALVGIGMLTWTWGTWLDPFIDFGRELYLPWQITEGQRLYADLASFNGPLSPYINAFWFTVFGVGLRSVILGNVLVLSVITTLLYAIVRQLFDRSTALVAMLFFLLVFAFGEYDDVGNFNYLTPYSHELVHGLALSLAGVLLTLRALDKPLSRLAVVALGAITGLTALTKPEVTLAALAAQAVGGLMLASAPAISVRRLVSTAVAWATGFAAAVLVIVGLLSSAMPLSAVLTGAVGPYRYALMPQLRQQTFYAEMAGFDHVGRSLVALSKASALWIAATAALMLVARWAPRRWRGEVGMVAALSTLLIAMASNKEIVYEIARPLPLVIVAIALVATSAWWRRAVSDGERDVDAAKILVFSVFSGTLLLKVVLNAHIRGYGFALTMPASLLCVALLVGRVPSALTRWGGDARLLKHLNLCLVAVLTLVFLLAHKERVDANDATVGVGPDQFFSDGRAPTINAAVRALEEKAAPGDTVAVLPEGVMLNYLTRKRSPIRFINFMPPELIMFREDVILDSLVGAPPEFVVVVSRPLREYGYVGFGVDFMVSTAEWIAANYVPVATIEGSAGKFGVELRQRRHHTSGVVTGAGTTLRVHSETLPPAVRSSWVP